MNTTQTKPNENQLAPEDQHSAILKAECDIRNAINLLSEQIPSLEFGPHGKAFDLVWDACRLLEEASEEARQKGWIE